MNQSLANTYRLLGRSIELGNELKIYKIAQKRISRRYVGGFPYTNNMTRIAILTLASIGTVVLLALLEPIPQDPSYHLFVDSRQFVGIPNFLNVYSSVPYLFIGIAGLRLINKTKSDHLDLAWGAFFLGVLLVGFGSAYYHVYPDNSTLVWDRAPMTIGFMGLFVALLCEWFSRKLKFLLLPMCLLGIYSVYYWHQTDDLRPYVWIQFFPLFFIVVAGILFKPEIPYVRYIYAGLACYVLSKLFEYFDSVIHNLTAHIISGHTLKHFAAAYAIYCVFLMLQKRATNST